MSLQKVIKKVVLFLAIAMCVSLVIVTTNAATNYSQNWSNGKGKVNYQNLSGGHFKVSWSNVGDFVCGKGYNPSGTRTMSWSGSASNAQYFGVYGWLTNPLVEYYIGRSGGSKVGTYSTSKGTYTLYVTSVTGPSIQGNTTFKQYNANGNKGSGINLAEHFNGWKKLGQKVGNTNYCIVSVEGWGGGSGSADVTVN
ncbi:MAG: glycoside hydrolase family 11 protein [Bacillota bacterium]|nr:glycoside hydrolase family 11 protein [Bacillota bacterium]